MTMIIDPREAASLLLKKGEMAVKGIFGVVGLAAVLMSANVQAQLNNDKVLEQQIQQVDKVKQSKEKINIIESLEIGMTMKQQKTIMAVGLRMLQDENSPKARTIAELYNTVEREYINEMENTGKSHRTFTITDFAEKHADYNFLNIGSLPKSIESNLKSCLTSPENLNEDQLLKEKLYYEEIQNKQSEGFTLVEMAESNHKNFLAPIFLNGGLLNKATGKIVDNPKEIKAIYEDKLSRLYELSLKSNANPSGVIVGFNGDKKQVHQIQQISKNTKKM